VVAFSTVAGLYGYFSFLVMNQRSSLRGQRSSGSKLIDALASVSLKSAYLQGQHHGAVVPEVAAPRLGPFLVPGG
jgi:hypothetical protein